MEEPDTRGDSGAFVLPYDVGGGGAARPERAGGTDLHELNRPERGRLKDAMLQLCEALAYIHQRGLVHRDLKPSNIMVDEDRQVRLMDFGSPFLADDAQVTADGRLVGTFRYMAPEAILGEPLDARADLYSLGVILYELLSGQPPSTRRRPTSQVKVLETEPVPLLAINLKGVQLARVAHRLMRKEPEARFQTAEEVLEALSSKGSVSDPSSTPSATPTTHELSVPPDKAGTRLDLFVGDALGLSRARLKRLFDEGAIRVDGRSAKKGQLVAAGQAVRVTVEEQRRDAVADATSFELAVLHEDAQLVFVDKPAGRPSHPLQPGETGTVANAPIARYPECAQASADVREGGLCHRLDVETSGCCSRRARARRGRRCARPSAAGTWTSATSRW